MKIIKKVTPTNWSTKFICTNCTSQLQISCRDIKVSSYINSCGHNQFDYSIICAACKLGVGLNIGMPFMILDYLNTRT